MDHERDLSLLRRFMEEKGRGKSVNHVIIRQEKKKIDQSTAVYYWSNSEYDRGVWTYAIRFRRHVRPEMYSCKHTVVEEPRIL